MFCLHLALAKFKTEHLEIKTELPFSLILDNVRDPGKLLDRI